MTTTAVLRGLITVDSAAAEAKLAGFGARINSLATSGSGSFSKLKAAGSIAMVGIGAAAAVGLVKAADAAKELGLETLRLGRQLGLSAEDASRMIAVGHELGLNVLADAKPKEILSLVGPTSAKGSSLPRGPRASGAPQKEDHEQDHYDENDDPWYHERRC